MTSHSILMFNSLVVAVGVVLLVVSYLLPFNFFVDVQDVEYHDVCVGSKSQLVTALREVKWVSSYNASVRAELFRYENDTKLETVIHRDRDFVYQISTQPVTYEIVWSDPITVPGAYGASDNISLRTIFGTKTRLFSEDNQRFNVVECNN